VTALQRRVSGFVLLAVSVVSALTLGYGVVGDRVAAFCIPEPAKEVNPWS
jgi:hypothetical protein